MNQDLVKLDHFDGSNFTCWKDKMKFLRITLKIFYVLDLNSQLIVEPNFQLNSVMGRKVGENERYRGESFVSLFNVCGEAYAYSVTA